MRNGMSNRSIRWIVFTNFGRSCVYLNKFFYHTLWFLSNFKRHIRLLKRFPYFQRPIPPCVESFFRIYCFRPFYTSTGEFFYDKLSYSDFFKKIMLHGNQWFYRFFHSWTRIVSKKNKILQARVSSQLFTWITGRRFQLYISGTRELHIM